MGTLGYIIGLLNSKFGGHSINSRTSIPTLYFCHTYH